jgi:spore coat protein JC
MWIYQKTLEYPVRIAKPDPRMAMLIITQYGGPDGEIGASLRYLSQRFAMPTDESKATLNDIGTEELAHMEMVGAMVRQLLKNATPDQIKAAGASGYFVEHGKGVYPASATGVPFSAAAFQSKDDVIANLSEDMAAEQKARATYEYLLRMADDPDVIAPLRFLREREVVHFQRFGETLVSVQSAMDTKKYY